MNRAAFRRRLACSLLGWLLLCTVSCNRQAAVPRLRQTPCETGHARVPDHGAYTGAYIDFGEQEDAVTLEGIEEFERLTGKHQAIIAFSSYWGEQHFPAAAAQIVSEHGSVPMIFWSPWDLPYSEELIEVERAGSITVWRIFWKAAGTITSTDGPMARRRLEHRCSFLSATR